MSTTSDKFFVKILYVAILCSIADTILLGEGSDDDD